MQRGAAARIRLGLGANHDVDIQGHVDGNGLVVQLAGAPLKLADGLDDASIQILIHRLHHLDILRFARLIHIQREAYLSRLGNDVVERVAGDDDGIGLKKLGNGYAGADADTGVEAAASPVVGWLAIADAVNTIGESRRLAARIRRMNYLQWSCVTTTTIKLFEYDCQLFYNNSYLSILYDEFLSQFGQEYVCAEILLA